MCSTDFLKIIYKAKDIPIILSPHSQSEIYIKGLRYV